MLVESLRGTYTAVVPGRVPYPPPPIFGIEPSALTTKAVARLVLDVRRTAAQGVGAIVTPNIQHVALMRHDAEFAASVREAEVRLCDGFPVHVYARARGHDLPGRAAGREVVARIMADPARLRDHRMLILADGGAVADAVAAWARAHDLVAQVRVVVAPPAFLTNADFCAELVATLVAFDTTIFLLGLGAPGSELFLHRHRAALPPCWALCIGQSVKIALGMVPTPPDAIARLNLEWAWRIALEPKRMIRRYVPAALGFAAAVVSDLRAR